MPNCVGRNSAVLSSRRSVHEPRLAKPAAWSVACSLVIAFTESADCSSALVNTTLHKGSGGWAAG